MRGRNVKPPRTQLDDDGKQELLARINLEITLERWAKENGFFTIDDPAYFAQALAGHAFEELLRDA